jgi:hypothetical protein
MARTQTTSVSILGQKRIYLPLHLNRFRRLTLRLALGCSGGRKVGWHQTHNSLLIKQMATRLIHFLMRAKFCSAIQTGQNWLAGWTLQVSMRTDAKLSESRDLIAESFHTSLFHVDIIHFTSSNKFR